MKKSISRYAIWIITFLIFGVAAEAVGTDQYISGDFNISSFDNVDDAVEFIQKTLESEGFNIVATVDHSANAAGVGLELRPTKVILFSTPAIDAKFIRRSPTVGIDLPQKILVWKNENDEIQLKFNNIGYLIDRHNIRVRDNFLRKNRNILTQFGALPNGLVTIDSQQSLKDTVDTLVRELKNAGFLVPLVIDYNQTSSQKFKKVRPAQLIIFGNPKIGSQLMQVNQAIGIDLPQKFFVWQNKSGQVHITYNDPTFLASRHDVFGVDELLERIAGALANFANLGAEGP